jgi:hypothetical protein
MGDPTLRMHPVKPVTGLSKVMEGNGVRLNWTAPAGETGVLGYSVYVRSPTGGPFVLCDGTPTSETTYLHSGGSTSATYMVRVLKYEDNTNSGVYYNLSQGTSA